MSVRPVTSSAGTTASVFPDPNAHTISKMDASKLGLATCATRAPGWETKTLGSNRFRRPRCETTTPLGSPVVPDVNSR